MRGPLELDPGKSWAGLVRSAAPFVDRIQELAWLERWLQEAIASRPGVVLIPGEAGIGKTRLLTELRSVAVHRGVQVCYGRCYEDLTLPYLPFMEALRPQLEQIPEEVERTLGADASIIDQLLGRQVATTPTANQSWSTQPDQDKLRLFLAVSHLIIKSAQSGPTLFVVDDLHWADQPSLDLFGHLVVTLAETALRETVPLLLIGMHRPVEPEERLARLIARLQREPICHTLMLPGLHEPEVHELIQGLGLARPSHQLTATVSAATQGNPLFVQEVFHHLIQQDALKERGGYVVTTASPADLRLPEQVTSAIATRTQGLSEDCRRALTLASILGERFSLQLLAAMSEMSEDELLDLLEEGMRQRLLLSDGQTFQFAHPLIRHVFYNAPSVVRRQRIHRQIAQTLEQLYADSRDAHVLEIAHHLVRAGPAAEAAKVVEYARRAADHACTVFAWGQAALYYEAALSAAESSDRLSAHDRAELHYRAGLAYQRDTDVGPCLDHYERAIAAYRLTGDIPGLARALMERTRIDFTLAAVPYGTLIDIQPLEAALEALGESEPGLRGSITAIISGAYFHAKQTDKAWETAQRALQIGEDLQ
ncbi:MAG: ATP-binding protein, partial [Candidatus Entotheonellia bacterium]